MAIDLRKCASADTQLNMTPMIDIVFQLILFFLFSLHFKSLDFRIETQMPNRYGINPGPMVDQPPHLCASLFRLDAEDPARARTKIRLGGREWIVPDIGRATPEARTAIFDQVRDQIASIHAVSDAMGEIAAPAPSGALVPHGDVIGVLDAFLGAKVKDVEFVGATFPMPRRR
jgi:hypothetical protein